MPRKKKEPLTEELEKEIKQEKVLKKKSQKKEIPYIAPEYIAPEFKEPELLYKYSDKIPKHPSRLNVYNKFFTLLQLHSNLDKSKLQAIVLNIEKSIFNYTLTFSVSKDWDTLFQTRYIGTSVKVYSNLNPDNILKNINLIKRLLNNEIKEYDIVKFTSQEMFPERHKEIVDIIVANTPKVAPKIEVKDMPDGQHKCGNCASQKKDAYKTTYYQLQTRSADESLTTFVQCVQCYKKWRY